MKDIPTPESDELIATFLVDYSDGMTVACATAVDQWNTMADKAISLERRLALALAENARLKAALDKYSEDEMLLIERCAKEAELWDSEPLSGRSIAACIRALKVERRIRGERRVGNDYANMPVQRTKQERRQK
jgi:hypothetical protein